MSAPHPKDPLDGPITEFIKAVDAFLTQNLDWGGSVEHIAPSNGTWEDVKRVWEESKREMRKAHAAFVSGVQPEVYERLEIVCGKGAVVLDLTDDPYIVGPVNDLMALMSEARSVVDQVGSFFSKGQSVLGFVGVILEAAGLKARIEPLNHKIVTARDALIAYNLMRPEPPAPA